MTCKISGNVCLEGKSCIPESVLNPSGASWGLKKLVNLGPVLTGYLITATMAETYFAPHSSVVTQTKYKKNQVISLEIKEVVALKSRQVPIHVLKKINCHGCSSLLVLPINWCGLNQFSCFFLHFVCITSLCVGAKNYFCPNYSSGAKLQSMPFCVLGCIANRRKKWWMGRQQLWTYLLFEMRSVIDNCQQYAARQDKLNAK